MKLAKKSQMGAALAAPVLALLTGLAQPALAAGEVGDATGGPAMNQLYMVPGVTPISQEIYELHNWMMVLCLVIFFIVFGVMFYSVVRHRKSLGHKADTWHESTKVEIAWTIVPFIIVILMALPATRTVIAMKDTSNADLTVKATGSQWKWGYDYLKGEGEGISFLSNLTTPPTEIGDPEIDLKANPHHTEYLMEVDQPLVVPVDKKIRIITTANDVVHSWAVPYLGVKQDAIPGFVRDTWFKATVPGIYRGECTELCGKQHAYMPVVVQVLSQPDYDKWVAAHKPKTASAAGAPAANS